MVCISQMQTVENSLFQSLTVRGDRERSPAVGEKVVVRCHGFRCLAYRDKEGVWRSVSDGRELRGAVEVVLRF